MLAKIINNWYFKGKEFKPNEIVDISPELFAHLSETNVVQKIKGKISKKVKITVVKI